LLHAFTGLAALFGETSGDALGLVGNPAELLGSGGGLHPWPRVHWLCVLLVGVFGRKALALSR
jgi:hypothetical protein